MADPAATRRAEAAAEGKDVTPVMATDKEIPTVVRVVWTDKGPEEQELEGSTIGTQNEVQIKRLNDKKSDK